MSTAIQLRDTLESLKAAIGDRLLADGPLASEYAWAVIGEVEAALSRAVKERDFLQSEVDASEPRGIKLTQENERLKAQLEACQVERNHFKDLVSR